MLAIFLIILSCSVERIDNMSPPQQPGIEYCVEACDNLISLDCDLGKPFIDDKKTLSCYDKCNIEHKEGYFWNTYCLMDIDSCDKVDNYCKSIYKKY